MLELELHAALLGTGDAVGGVQGFADQAVLLVDRYGQLGAVFGLPDYNPRIKAIDGRLFPLGIFKLLSRKQDFRRARVLAANVLPEYQHWGVGLVLLRALLPKVLESGLQEVEFSWVMESNKLSRGSLEKGGALLEKRYRLYDFPTPAAPEPK